MSHDHVQGLDGLEGDAGEPAGQRLVQRLQADAGHPLDGHFEAAVFAFAGDGHLQLHLCEDAAHGDTASQRTELNCLKPKPHPLCPGRWAAAWQCRDSSSRRTPASGRRRFAF